MLSSSVSGSSWERGLPRRFVRIAYAGLLISLVSGGWGCVAGGRASTSAGTPALSAPAVWSGKVTQPDGTAVEGALVEAYEVQSRYEWVHGSLRSIGRCSTKADGVFSFDASQSADCVMFAATKSGLSLGWAQWQANAPGQSLDICLESPLRLSGRVMDGQGQPVADAGVSLRLRRAGDGNAFEAKNVLRGLDVLTARTDSTGTFEFKDMPGGCVADFLVAAPGYGLLDTVFSRSNGYSVRGTEVVLTLQPGGTIEALVVSKDTGEPVADARLAMWASGRIWDRLGEPVPGKPGRYQWKDMPTGPADVSIALPVDRPAAWVGNGRSVEIKAGQTVETKIEVVRGQVLEIAGVEAASGRPVPSFGVAVLSKEHFFSKGTSDKSGIVRLGVIPSSYEVLFVESPGYTPGRISQKFVVSAGKPARVKMRLERLPKYKGTVRDTDAKPVRDVEVRLLLDGGIATSDASGAFEVSRREGQFYSRRETALILRSEQRNLAAVVPARLPDRSVDVTLRPGYTWQVTITDEQGQPIKHAEITATLGHVNVDAPGGTFSAFTDANGQAQIRGLPVDMPLCLRAQATDYVAQDVYLSVEQIGPGQVRSDVWRLKAVAKGLAAPKVQEVAIPKIPDDWAIWGATGRDDRGHIWFATTAHRAAKYPSAHLFELLPDRGQVVGRGDVVAELHQTRQARRGDQQMKIHTKMCQVGEYLYFASNDEEGWDIPAEKLPTYGGHLWRLRLSDYRWEHIKAAPEALIALAVGNGKVYFLGYWGHILYQFDPATGRTRKVKVGSSDSHISRNIVADAYGHVYVPRVTHGKFETEATLVEYDADLKEAGQTPLRSYFQGIPHFAHGITALQPLPDGSIAILTNNGYLTIIEPQEKGPAKVRHVGWFHPDGPHYAASLFADPTGRYLMGAARRGRGGGSSQPYDWVVYDLKTGAQYLAPFERDGQEESLAEAFLYGSQTQDDAGRCYIVGGWKIGSLETMRPMVLQVMPSPLPEADRMTK